MGEGMECWRWLLLKEIEQRLLIVETVAFEVEVVNFEKTFLLRRKQALKRAVVSLTLSINNIGSFDVSRCWQ